MGTAPLQDWVAAMQHSNLKLPAASGYGNRGSSSSRYCSSAMAAVATVAVVAVCHNYA